MATLASLDDVKARMDRTLDTDEERIALGALEDASELARGYGRDWPTASSAPRLVRTLVLRAVTRYLHNPEGFTVSRAGDETVGWSDKIGHDAGTVYFTPVEVELIQSLAGKTKGLKTAGIVAWDSKPSAYGRQTEGFVPTSLGKPFPYFNSDEGPW